MVARLIVIHNNFQEGFGHIWIKIRHLKGASKWENSRRLDLNGPDIEVP